eukprot:GHRR01026068.1.p2 GENE.GHRR01026068.1~~GHRR01026068.1.p2  ORF type:complete len:116 (-),score=30.05 GHRR01026068.1:5-352(-)
MGSCAVHVHFCCWHALWSLDSGTHKILKPYDSNGMAAQLYFTADAPDSRFFRSWDLDLALDVLQVEYWQPACKPVAPLLTAAGMVHVVNKLLRAQQELLCLLPSNKLVLMGVMSC